MSTPPPARMPRQIPFIIANEGCERFSFYGMRNILSVFLASTFFAHLATAEAQSEAKEIFHVFVAGVYFFPLLGGWLSDRFFGKYHTILWVSLIYCAGHACLAAFEDRPAGFYFGLFLIALGSGGIKPLVSTFMGDQFDQSNKHLARLAFDAFYWIINFGSFFASLVMPKLLEGWGPAAWWGLPPASVAFGVPGILMAIATICFWAGRGRYVRVPSAPPDAHAFSRVVRTALLAPGTWRPGLRLAQASIVLALGSIAMIPVLGWSVVIGLCTALVLLLAGVGAGAWMQLERARGPHPDEAVDGVRSVLRVLVIFALVTPFWSLFDQKASTWVFQADLMTKPAWFSPAQMQALNPALVMLLIPFNNLLLWPALRRRGREPSQLAKMACGIALAGASWIVVGAMQLLLDAGHGFSIVWQVVPYVLLTAGEVLVSATGLEFAYSQAPAAMKGVIMSFWSLAVTVGNLWVLMVNAAVKNEAVEQAIAGTGLGVIAFQMFFFAAFAFASALAFRAVAGRYRMQDNYRAA
ncbi:MAG: POT family MFS transporter [Planctomycetes bacterium]|nr:POT family MFS transporter [Planctomycetota bacterium]